MLGVGEGADQGTWSDDLTKLLAEACSGAEFGGRGCYHTPCRIAVTMSIGKRSSKRNLTEARHGTYAGKGIDLPEELNRGVRSRAVHF